MALCTKNISVFRRKPISFSQSSIIASGNWSQSSFEDDGININGIKTSVNDIVADKKKLDNVNDIVADTKILDNFNSYNTSDDNVIATMINHNDVVDDTIYGTLVIEKIGGEDDTIFSFDIDPDASGLLTTQVITYNGCGSTMISSVSPGKYIVRLRSHADVDERLVIISPGGKGSVSFM